MIASATYVPSEYPGFVDGKTPVAHVQTMSAKTTSQLQLTPKGIPAMRPSVKVLPVGYRAFRACWTAVPIRLASTGPCFRACLPAPSTSLRRCSGGMRFQPRCAL
jgi:hypothetical protein